MMVINLYGGRPFSLFSPLLNSVSTLYSETEIAIMSADLIVGIDVGMSS